MTARYAVYTSVSPARSKAEIEELIRKYGGLNVLSGDMEERHVSVLTFTMKGRRIQFELPLPRVEAFSTRMVAYHRGGKRHEKEVQLSPEQQFAAWDAAVRQRWRALKLLVQARLEAVATGISTFEAEFLADTVVPVPGGGVKRFADAAAPAVEEAYRTGTLPPLLLGAGDAK